MVMGYGRGNKGLLLLLPSIVIVHGQNKNNPTCGSSEFYSCVSEQTATCFDSSKFAQGALFTRPRKIILETADWQSHRIIMRAAEILLREHLGYEVEVRDYASHGSGTAAYTDDADGCGASYQASAYCRLKDGHVDINFELWPGSLPAELATSLQAKVLLTASQMGEVGYEARSGWFIPVSSLRDVATGPLGDAPWRSLMPLFNSDAVQSSIVNHTRLPTPASTCDAAKGETMHGFGSYDCERGAYTSPTSACCSSSAAASGSCSESQKPCGVLMSSSPKYDVGRNEAALAGSALPIEIQYGDVEALVERAEAEALPALVYAWEPWPSFVAKGRMIRVGLTDQVYCQAYGGATSSSAARKSNVNVLYENACDFPQQKLVKIAANRLITGEEAALQFAADFNFSYAQITQAMDDAEFALAANSTLDAPHADAFNRACGLLKASSGIHSGSGSWERWILQVRAVYSKDDRRVDYAFRQLLLDPATGSLVSDSIFLVLITLTVATAMYVFGRGDDGYTSGWSCCTLPKLLRSLYRGTKTLITCGCSSPSEVVIRSVSELEDSAIEGPPAAAGLETAMTLGRSMIVVSSTDAYVAVPILRIDKAEGRVIVSVKTVEEETEGNAARYGRNFGRIREGQEDPPDPNEVKVTFEPGVRLKFVYIDILKRDARIPAEHDCATFSLALSEVALQEEGQVRTAIGPVGECIVRIIAPMEFPVLALTTSMKKLDTLRSFAADKVLHVTNEVLHATNELAAPISATSDILGTITTIPTAKKPVMRRRSSLQDVIAAKRRASVQDTIARGLVVLKFLRWAMRINGLSKKVIWHQATSVLLAIFHCFLRPLAYSYIIYFGVERKRGDVAMWLALLMVFFTLIECALQPLSPSQPSRALPGNQLLLPILRLHFSPTSRYRISLNYFHGSMLVMQNMRAFLLRKYLSLSHADRISSPALTEHFRISIVFTVEEVRNQTWKGVFHHGLPNLYHALASAAFLFCFNPDELTGLIALGLFVMVVWWYVARSIQGGAIATKETELSHQSEEKLNAAMKEWAMIQECEMALASTQRVFDAFWLHIRKGMYVVWYHRFYTRWAFKGLRLAVIYLVVWLLSPTWNASDFVAVHTALLSLGNCLQRVAENVLDVLVSSSKINEIGKLLNYPTNEQHRLKKTPHAISREGHRQVTTSLDAVIRKWELNAADAQATMELIAQTRALDGFAMSAAMTKEVDSETPGSEKGASAAERRAATELIDDLAELVSDWASLLDNDAVDDGGSCIIYDIHYAVPNGVVGMPDGSHDLPIFDGLCVVDHTSESIAAKRAAAGAHAEEAAMPRTPIRLPSGVVVGVCTTSNVGGFANENADPRSSFALLQMLCGRLIPERGFARSLVQVLCIDNTPEFQRGTLLDNLLAFSGDQSGREPETDDVWELCHRVGMHASIIGSTPSELVGWGQRMLTVHTIPFDDQIRIALVRALLARPEALVLTRVFEGWTQPSVRRVFDTLHAYLDGSLGELTHKHTDEARHGSSRHTRPSVIYNSGNEQLGKVLRPGDVVLSIHSRQHATLRKFQDAFASEVPRQKFVKPASPRESPSRTNLLQMIQQEPDARNSQHGWLERQMKGIDDSDGGNKSD